MERLNKNYKNGGKRNQENIKNGKNYKREKGDK